MTKKHSLLATTAITALTFSKALAPAVAQADSANFSGPFISAGVEFEEQEVDIKENASNIPTAAVFSDGVSANVATSFTGFNASGTTIIGRAAKTLTSDDTSTKAVLQAGNFFPINDKFLIGISAKASVGGDSITKNGSYTLSTLSFPTSLSATIANTTGTTKHEITDNHSYGIEITPAYAINDKVMAYASLGYGVTNKEVTTRYDGTSIKKTTEEDVDSISGSLGLRYQTDSSFFIDVNATYTEYDDIQTNNNDGGTSVTDDSFATVTNGVRNNLINTFSTDSYSLGIKVGKKF